MKIFILLLILSIIFISISSCFIPHGSSSTAEITPIKPLSLSRAPKLNNTAELTFINNMKFYTTFKDEPVNPEVRVWVEFTYANINGSYLEAKHAVPVPLDEVLVNGALAWEGNPYEIEDILELSGTVQFNREGVLEITGYIEAEGFDSPIVDKLFKEQMRVAVTEDAAAIIGSREFRTGPLSYLGNFPYGQVSEKVTNEFSDPVVLELDISRIPRVGEEAIISCRVVSLKDLSDFSAQVMFYNRSEDQPAQKIPASSLLVDDDLSWSGDLEEEEPVIFSSLIRLPDEGEWLVYASGDYPTNERIGYSDTIKMSIKDNIRYFGWEERPAIPLSVGKEVAPTKIPTPSNR